MYTIYVYYIYILYIYTIYIHTIYILYIYTIYINIYYIYIYTILYILYIYILYIYILYTLLFSSQWFQAKHVTPIHSNNCMQHGFWMPRGTYWIPKQQSLWMPPGNKQIVLLQCFHASGAAIVFYHCMISHGYWNCLRAPMESLDFECLRAHMEFLSCAFFVPQGSHWIARWHDMPHAFWTEHPNFNVVPCFWLPYFGAHGISSLPRNIFNFEFRMTTWTAFECPAHP